MPGVPIFNTRVPRIDLQGDAPNRRCPTVAGTPPTLPGGVRLYRYFVLFTLRPGFGLLFTLLLPTALTLDTTLDGGAVGMGSTVASAIANRPARTLGAKRAHSSKSLAVSASSLARLVARSRFEGTSLVPCSPV